MPQYSYPPVSLGSDSIRLLRLMPNKDETAPIECRLCDYPLQKSDNGTHLYEALSYVWGSSDKVRSVFIDGCDLPITENLYNALSRLRDRSFERIIWADSVCINQADEQEKERQIHSMAKIYGQANRVIVYLGEAADNSDQALEDIRAAAEDESPNSSNSEKSQKEFLKLLERPWFRRIWVLQEVAVARCILIICGSTEMNGYTFCLGFNKLELSYEAHPDLQSLIRATTYLIRGAIFRPKYVPRSPGGLSLGELIDMYHTHEASKRHDKVYALLGMSSDDPSAAGLSPDYGVPWKSLFQRLIGFILSNEVSVETWDESEIAVIKSKGCFLGQVSSVESQRARYDRQQVNVVFNNTHKSLEYQRKYGTQWTLQASAKPIRQDDFVYLVQGVSKPTIIRRCKDHFSVIMIAVTPQPCIQTDSAYFNRQYLSAPTNNFSTEFLLVWNWEKSPENLQDRAGYETSLEINILVPEYLKTASNKTARSYDVALVLGGSEDYIEAGKRLQEAVKGCSKAFGKEDLRTLAGMENLALIYKMQREWTRERDLLLPVVEIRKRVQGMDHQDTLNSIANLVSAYGDQQNLPKEGREVITSLKDQIRDNQITGEDMVHAMRHFGKEIITHLLDLKRDNVLITKEIVKAAASNEYQGQAVMALLLDRRGTEVKITKEVVKAAAMNESQGQEVMALLLDRRGTEVKITEEVVKIVARNSRGHEVIALLLDRRGDEVKITEEVVKAAAGNSWSNKVIALLLDRCGDKVKITEEVVKIVARNSRGHEVIALLLDRRGDEVKITEEVVKAAAGNSWSNKVIALLLDRCGDEVKITEEVVKAAARNSRGHEVIALLLDRRGNKVKITEEVVKAAAGNPWSNEVIALLLDRRSNEVKITEEVVKAAARNSLGYEVIALLLDRRSDEVKITEEVVKAAAGSSWCNEVIALLLDRRGDEVKITEEVVKAVARNKYQGQRVIRLLLDRRSDEVKITEEVVKAAAENSRGHEVIALLLDRRSNEVKITEEVVKAVAMYYNQQVMALLLDRCGDEVKITEEVVKAAAGNSWSNKVIALLLDRRGDEVKITEEVVKAAARNKYQGQGVIRLLLDRRGTEVKITEEVVKAAAMNESQGQEVMALLLDRRGTEVKITEEVVKAAAINESQGQEVMALLLDRRGTEVKITEEVVKIVASNLISGQRIMELLRDRRGAECHAYS